MSSEKELYPHVGSNMSCYLSIVFVGFSAKVKLYFLVLVSDTFNAFPAAVFVLHLLFVLHNCYRNDRLGFHCNQWDIKQGKGWVEG